MTRSGTFSGSGTSVYRFRPLQAKIAIAAGGHRSWPTALLIRSMSPRSDIRHSRSAMPPLASGRIPSSRLDTRVRTSRCPSGPGATRTYRDTTGRPPPSKVRMLLTVSAVITSDQHPEELEHAIPFLGVHQLQLGVDEPEHPGQRHGDATEDQGQPRLRVVVQRHIERRTGGQILQDGPDLDVLIHPLEGVHAVLQPLGERQVPRVDDVAD